MKRSRKSERTLNSCMRHGDDHGMESGRKRKHLEPLCDVQGMSATTAETETDYEDCSNYARAQRVLQVF